MPQGAVYIGRPTQWGNPFRAGVGICETANEAVVAFESYVQTCQDYCQAVRRELRGKNLACWCPLDQPCHGDVLLEIANEFKGNQT